MAVIVGMWLSWLEAALLLELVTPPAGFSGAEAVKQME